MDLVTYAINKNSRPQQRVSAWDAQPAAYNANGLTTSTMTTQLNGITFNATKDITITTAEINNLCV